MIISWRYDCDIIPITILRKELRPNGNRKMKEDWRFKRFIPTFYEVVVRGFGEAGGGNTSTGPGFDGAETMLIGLATFRSCSPSGGAI
jgi:hypothetical protein